MRHLCLRGMVLACLACWAGQACGQEATAEDLPAIPEVEIFSTNMSYHMAFEESKREYKPLVIYLRPDSGGSDEMDETTWQNPTLEAWVKWHAIAMKVDKIEQPGLFNQLRYSSRELAKIPGNFPIVLIFIRGKLFKIIPDPSFQALLWKNSIIGPADQTVFYPKAVQLVLQLDHVLERLKAMDPVWSEFHERKNPMPQPPEFEPLYATSSSIAPDAADPDRGESPDAVKRYMHMLELIEAGQFHDATGPMTWLWEKAAQRDPTFETVRTIMLPERMNFLARARDGSRHRVSELRWRLGQRLAWMDWQELFDWMVLNEALDESPWSFQYFVGYTIDDQEATMLPINHRVAYLLLTSQDRWTGLPESQGPEAIKWIQRQQRLLQSTQKPRTVSDHDWADVQALRQRLLTHQACRLYAAWLKEGQDQLAMKAAQILIKAVDDGPTRQKLVAAALAAGEPRAHQINWLDEAAQAGVPHPGLRSLLENQLGASQ